jgi:ech hydrogenase subunit D
MDAKGFLDRVAQYKREGWRLALVNATSLPAVEGEGAVDLSWSFEKEGRLEHLRERVTPAEEVPSVSSVFGAAFLYENEIRELFGLNVTGLNVDFRGALYKTAERVPFAPRAIRARLEAKGKRS